MGEGIRFFFPLALYQRALLLALAHYGPSHSLTLKRRLPEPWFRSIYVDLGDLEDRGLVERRLDYSESPYRGGYERFLYSLTQEGRQMVDGPPGGFGKAVLQRGADR